MVQVRSLAEEDDEVFTGDISLDEVRWFFSALFYVHQGLLDTEGDETVPSYVVSEVSVFKFKQLVSAVVKVTVEETNVESMDTTDADDTETITLTRNKVLLLFMYVHIQDVCRVLGMLLVQLMGPICQPEIFI